VTTDAADWLDLTHYLHNDDDDDDERDYDSSRITVFINCFLASSMLPPGKLLCKNLRVYFDAYTEFLY